jgi:hypothetical protein
MPCDLDSRFAKLAARLPVDDKTFSFSATTVTRPRPLLTTDRLIIEKGCHFYEHQRLDCLVFHATKDTYRQLALLILGVVFTDVRTVEVRLTHPASNIRRLRVRLPQFEDCSGYHSRPGVLNYYAREVPRNSLMLERISLEDLPAFYLTNAEEDVGIREADWNARDTVIGFGNDRGNVRLAQLLLDLSRPDATINDFFLEGENGMRGVAPRSCEARLWLPGKNGWRGERAPLGRSSRRARRS